MSGFRVLILSMVMGLGLCFCGASLSLAAKAPRPKPKPPLYEPVSTKRSQAKLEEKFSQTDGFVFSEYWLTMPLVKLSLPSEPTSVLIRETVYFTDMLDLLWVYRKLFPCDLMPHP